MAALRTAILADNPVALWMMQLVTDDYLGYRNETGAKQSLAPSPYSRTAPGSFAGSNAIDLRGNSDRYGLIVPNIEKAPFQITGDLSVEFVLAGQPGQVPSGTILSWSALGESSSTNILYSMVIVGQVIYNFHEYDNGTDQGTYSADAGINDDSEHHYVIVRDNTAKEYRTYLDGALAATNGFSHAASGGDSGQLYVGTYGDGTRYLSGLMQALAIHASALSDARISAHFAAYQTDLNPPSYKVTGNVNIDANPTARRVRLFTVPSGNATPADFLGQTMSDANTGAYEIDFKANPDSAVIGIADDDYGGPWKATTAYAVGDATYPTMPNNHWYKCITAGTSGGVEPGWTGTTINDGTVQWADAGAMRAPEAQGPYIPTLVT